MRICVFSILFALASRGCLALLTPEYDYGQGSMMNLYSQERDTVDVLVLGTSLAYAGVNTNLLYSRYGIAAYDLCAVEQQYFSTLCYLEEALKTQSPRLVVLDAKAAAYPNDTAAAGRVILNCYGIRSFLTRTRAVLAAANAQEREDLLLAWPQVHANYSRLGEEAFLPGAYLGGRSSSWKGYVENDRTEPHDPPSADPGEERKPINAREEQAFLAIAALCRQRGIPLLVIALPHPDRDFDLPYDLSLSDLCREQGVDYMDFGDPTLGYGFDYAADFADWQHLNVKGGAKMAPILGEYLKAHYDLPDRRGEKRGESWQKCLEEWLERFPEYR